MEYSPIFLLKNYILFWGSTRADLAGQAIGTPRAKLIGREPSPVANLTIFFPNEKSLLYVKIIFFRSKFGKNS
jgi:hypothetical protein